MVAPKIYICKRVHISEEFFTLLETRQRIITVSLEYKKGPEAA